MIYIRQLTQQLLPCFIHGQIPLSLHISEPAVPARRPSRTRQVIPHRSYLQDEKGLAAADGQGIAEITQSQEIPGLQRLAGLSGSFRQEPLGQDEIFR